MGLTDPLLPWLLGVAAAVVFVLLVVGWPQWPRRSLQAVTRGVEGLLLTGLALTTCFLVLNNAYIFYSGWTDLLGNTHRHTVSHLGGSPLAAEAGAVPGPGLTHVRGVGSYALPDPRRSIEAFSVRDSASGRTMRVLVHLPLGYDPASPRRYPVILGLHGYPSVPESFVRLNFLSMINRLTAQGRLARSIVVIPQINSPRSLDTECVNGPVGDPQTDTWLAQELPRWIAQHFRVRTNRQSWATLGYSFGGWCAASLAVRHPEVFGAAMVFEGYFEPLFGNAYHPLTAAELRGYDLIRRAREAAPPVALWVFASRQDPLAYPTTHRFLRAVRAPTTVTAVIVPVGGHRDSVFQPYVPSALTWLARTLPGFRP